MSFPSAAPMVGLLLHGHLCANTRVSCQFKSTSPFSPQLHQEGSQSSAGYPLSLPRWFHQVFSDKWFGFWGKVLSLESCEWHWPWAAVGQSLPLVTLCREAQAGGYSQRMWTGSNPADNISLAEQRPLVNPSPHLNFEMKHENNWPLLLGC